MVSLRTVVTSPFSVSLLVVGLLLCPLLVGIEPIGGDPDLMYRPIKFELRGTCVRESCPTGVIASAWEYLSWPKAMWRPFIPPTGSSIACWTFQAPCA